MATKGFCRDCPDGSQQVGASDEERGYDGPVADVRHDEAWLHIETDPYEGIVMLNIEALPHLIVALRKIEASVAKASGLELQAR